MQPSTSEEYVSANRYVHVTSTHTQLMSQELERNYDYRLTIAVASLKHCGEGITKIHVIEGDLGGCSSVRIFLLRDL